MENNEIEVKTEAAEPAVASTNEAPVERESGRDSSEGRPAREFSGRRERSDGDSDRPSYDRGGPRGASRGPRRQQDDAGGRRKRFSRRKLCPLCTAKVKDLDYKDVSRMKQFVTERGKIRPRRMTGMCAKHQRQVTVCIKRARNLALMPFKI